MGRQLARLRALAHEIDAVVKRLAEITTRWIRRGVFRLVRSPEKPTRAYVDACNENAVPFNRTVDADNVLRCVKNACINTSDSAH